MTLTLAHISLNWWYSASDTNCSRYYLAVRDGVDADAPLIGQYCSNNVPPSITSSVRIFLTVSLFR